MPLSRRKFLFLSFLGITGFLLLDAFWIEKYLVNWSRHDLRKGGGKFIKLIQLTDLHIREIKTYHKWIAKRIKREKPDIIFFTGDCIDWPKHLGVLEDLLKLIPMEIPKIVIMGNAEYDGKITAEMYHQLFGKYNGKLLVNDSVEFVVGNRKINIVGIDDLLNGSPDFETATDKIDKTLTTIVLNHCPLYRDTIDQLNPRLKVNIKLILCGHTHGGQVQIFGRELFKPRGSGIYLNGWYNNEQSHMYVSKGVGTSKFLPLRFGARAEIPIFYL